MKQKEKRGIRNLWIITALIFLTGFISLNNLQIKFFLYRHIHQIIEFLTPIAINLTQLTINNTHIILRYTTLLITAIITIKLTRNKKVQEKIILPLHKFLTQKLLTFYKETSTILKDILSTDKTTINSFFKELKAELGSKEGKKRLLSISSIGVLILVVLTGGVTLADYSVLPEDLNETEQAPTENNIPTINAYTPEQDTITILANEPQAFTITASDLDNDTLSIQWYVNNLPITGQTLESFEYNASEHEEFEIKVLITDNKDYATHKWVLKAEQELEPELPVENLTEPVNETQEAIPELENITEPVNETIETTEDDQLIQLQAEINKPVQWKRIIKNKDLTTRLRIRIPKQATNIKAQKITKLITEELKEDINPEKLLLNGKRPSTGFTSTGMAVLEIKKDSWIIRFFNNIFRLTGFATAEQTTEQELVIEEAAAEYEVSYETPAPLAEETELENGKRVRIYADYHYENILTYSTIRETEKDVKLYWQTNGTNILHEADLIDMNNNGLTDKVQWITEHLSEQTFFINMTDTTSYDYLNGTFNRTEYNSTIEAVTLSSNDTEQELLGNQEDEVLYGVFGGVNMSGNTFLFHFNNDSNYGESESLYYDFSGNGYNGTGQNSPLHVAYGVLNESVDLDGAADYIELTTYMGKVQVDNQGTVMAWVNVTSGSDYLLSLFKAFGAQRLEFLVTPTYLKIFAWTQNVEATVSSLSLADWHHVAFVQDGVSAKIFLDGKEQSLTTNTLGGLWFNDVSFPDILAIGLMSTDYFRGGIDEFSIWNRTLSADEIKNVYDRQKSHYIDKGVYTSDVFDVGSEVSWVNISWTEGTPYDEELPSNQVDELNSGILGGANMTENVLLLHFNNDSNFGENDTYAYDFSGHQRNATGHSFNNDEVNYSGKLGGAFEFDGTDDHMHLDSKVGVTGTKYTFLFWAIVETNDKILLGQDGDGNTYGGYFLDGSLYHKPATSGLNYCYASTGLGNTFSDWHHFATRRNGDGNDVDFFVDGVKIPASYDASTLPDNAFTPDLVGAYNGGLYFDGKVDELAIWNRSLSDDEILDIYERGALRLNVSVRSCDDSVCSGEDWNLSFTNSTYNNISSLADSQYFQYQAWFEDTGNSNITYTPELYNVTISYRETAFSLDCSQGCLYIRNSTSDNVSIFDYSGNLFLAGSFTSNSVISPDGSDFIIKDNSGDSKAWIDDATGNMKIAGTKTEETYSYCTTPPSKSFIIKDKSGNCVSYIDSSGNLWLRGGLTENYDINP